MRLGYYKGMKVFPMCPVKAKGQLRYLWTVAKSCVTDLEIVQCPSQTQLKTAPIPAIPSAIQGRKKGTKASPILL